MDMEQELRRLQATEQCESDALADSRISLRDQFAIAALAGLSTQHETLLANQDLLAELGTLGIDKLQANKAYRLADAMLKERAR